MKNRLFGVKALFTFLLVCTLATASGIVTKAATPTPAQVTELKQTDAYTSSVRVEWKALLDNGIHYRVQVYDEAGKKWIEKNTTTINSALIQGLNAGTTYQIKVIPYVIEHVEGKYENGVYVRPHDVEITGPESAVLSVVTIPNSAPSTIKHTKSTYDSITINWSKVQGANTYRVEYGKTGTDYAKYKQVIVKGKEQIVLKKLSKNCEYNVRIYAGRNTTAGAYSYEKYYGSYKSINNLPVRPSKVSGLEVPYYWQNIREIKAECNTNKAADGYQWQCYTAYKDKDTAVQKGTSTRNSIYFRKNALKNHNFYKVRVRAYSTDSNGKKYYSDWTSWKYVCPQPDVTKIKYNKKGVSLSWDKIKGADRYIVYMSTKKNSGYKKVATTTKTSKTITKFNKKKVNSKKTYYFYVVAQNKVGKKYYSGAAGNADRRYYNTKR